MTESAPKPGAIRILANYVLEDARGQLSTSDYYAAGRIFDRFFDVVDGSGINDLTPEKAVDLLSSYIVPSETAEGSDDSQVYLHNGFYFRPDTRLVISNGRATTLGPILNRILECLCQRPNECVSFPALRQNAGLTSTRNIAATAAGNLLRWHINRLRGIIERDPENPEFIITIHRQGYAFMVQSPRRDCI